MVDLQKEKAFFKKSSSLVFDLLSSFEQKTLTITYKQREAVSDIVTSSDIAIENLLTKEINKLFPDDVILGEENSSDLKINPNIRTWIIDPICGTINYSRGIRNFCTNIALSQNNKIIAACVLDHSRNEYIWSTGNNQVYLNDTIVKPTNNLIPLIDIDLGGIYYANNNKVKRKYSNFLYKIITETNYIPVSHNTSQGFAYASIGRLDGYFVISPHVWDVAAANFLLIQSGGVVSNLSGKPWTLSSPNVLAARNKAVHSKLLNLYLNI